MGRLHAILMVCYLTVAGPADTEPAALKRELDRLMAQPEAPSQESLNHLKRELEHADVSKAERNLYKRQLRSLESRNPATVRKPTAEPLLRPKLY